MTQLHRLLYCSRNLIPGVSTAMAENIDRILAVSRENNAREGITGGLLFSKGYFAQVLEGPLDAVERTFERIQCDDRHGDVVVLQSGPISARDFPDWSMAFTGSDVAITATPGAPLAGAFSGQSSSGDEILILLKAVVVRETNWLAPLSELVARPRASARAVV